MPAVCVCVCIVPQGAGNTAEGQSEKGAVGGAEGGVGRPQHNRARILASMATLRDEKGTKVTGSVKRSNPKRDALCIVLPLPRQPKVLLADSCRETLVAALDEKDPRWREDNSDTRLKKDWVCTCAQCA